GPFGIGVSNFPATVGSVTPLTIYSALLDASGSFVAVQQVRGGTTATVNVSSSSTTVGNINGSASSAVSIAGGASQNTANFNAIGPGTSNLSLDVPSGFNTPAALYKTVQSIVSQPSISVTNNISIGKNLQ